MAKINITVPNLSEKQIERFWQRVDKSPGQGPQGECWEWRGYKTRGYGRFVVKRRGVTIRFRCHRIAHYLTTGSYPDLLICHTCDNPPCCNPDHLFEGTQTDNMQDAKRKGRMYIPPPRPIKQARCPSRSPHSAIRNPIYKAKPYPSRKPRQLRLKLTGIYIPRPGRCKRYALANFTPGGKSRTSGGRGERHARAKLTKMLVLKIREEYAAGVSGPVLADKYGVHRASIRDVVLRRSWNHV